MFSSLPVVDMGYKKIRSLRARLVHPTEELDLHTTSPGIWAASLSKNCEPDSEGVRSQSLFDATSEFFNFWSLGDFFLQCSHFCSCYLLARLSRESNTHLASYTQMLELVSSRRPADLSVGLVVGTPVIVAFLQLPIRCA